MLKVKRKRIINPCDNSALGKELLQFVSLFDTHNILVVDVSVAGKLCGKSNFVKKSLFGKHNHISFRNNAAFLIPLFKVAQTDSQYRSLNSVKTAVYAYFVVEVSLA